MDHPFSRTLRSLEGERSRTSLLFLAGVVALLGAWSAWFLAAELPVYVVSATARLEARQAVYPISAQVGGRLRRVAVAVGQEVKPGDVLVELEGEVDDRRTEEERARAEALVRQLASRRAERASQAAGLESARKAAELGRREATERIRAAEADATVAAEDLGRKERLQAGGLLPASDLDRARADAERRQAEAAEKRLAFGRLDQEWSREESDRRADLEDLDREIALLVGDLSAGKSAVRRLEAEGRFRTVRAPVAGRVADLARLDAGALVQPGERLGTVVPTSRLKVVGAFEPSQALGRLRPGQVAQVRLDAFPWTEFGSLHARVSAVSGELREGRVWADLDLEAQPGSRIPLQHGLPGLVLVEAERLTPAEMLLRALGTALSSRQGTAGK
ncbi:MAG: HlyD family secretion protein [Thermoanaerobaculia bacterium]